MGKKSAATATKKRPRRQGRGTADAITGWRDAIAAGDEWFDSLLHAIARWETSEERIDGRTYRYLIGGEAFDWLLLAERLCDEANGAIPDEEREALLFFGRAPRQVDDREFRRAIGDAKHRAHLNFLYGVAVEEALQLTVEQEVLKERSSLGGVGARVPVDETMFERVYSRPRAELLREYYEALGATPPETDEMSYSELRSFTYWLFKYRVNQSDPARVASDTRKALAQVSELESAARRRAHYWQEHAVTSGPVVDGEVVAHVR